MRVLALETSTSAAKAAYSDGPTMETRSVRLGVTGSAESRELWKAFSQLATVGHEVLESRSTDAIALTGTWHGTSLADHNMNPVVPLYEWPHVGPFGPFVERFDDPAWNRHYYHQTGCLVSASYPSFRLSHLAQEHDIRGLRFVDQPTYSFWRMTGQYLMGASLASGTGLMNVLTGDWDRDLISELGLNDLLFPRIVADTTHRPLTSAAAHALGAMSGLPVIVPGPDGALSQLGELADNPGDMTVSMGTSGALRVTCDEPTFSEQMSTWTYRSPRGWLSGAATSGCGNCIDWATRTLLGKRAPSAETDTLAAASSGLPPVFLPFLFGERSPGWNTSRTGGFVDLTPAHGSMSMYKGVLEGIVYSLYQCYVELTELNGPPKSIRLSGGVTSSPTWLQMTVDAFQQPMLVSREKHASMVGAVRLAHSALGESLNELDPLGQNCKLVEPQEAMRHYYQEGFGRYLAAYSLTDPKNR